MVDTLSKEHIEMLAFDKTPKFLATVDANGGPNLVPVISLMAEDEKTILFAEFMIWKTKKNLLERPNVGIAVLSPDMRWAWIRGTFQGFETKGPRYEKMSMIDMFRFNAYTGIRSAGVIRVDKTGPVRKLMSGAAPVEALLSAAQGRVAFALEAMLRPRGADGDPAGVMPPTVGEKFMRLKAGKAIAVMGGDGFPCVSVCPTLFPVGPRKMKLSVNDLPERARSLDPPPRAAVSVITSDPIAYQAKGVLKKAAAVGPARFAELEIEEVYNASPPLQGKKIS